MGRDRIKILKSLAKNPAIPIDLMDFLMGYVSYGDIIKIALASNTSLHEYCCIVLAASNNPEVHIKLIGNPATPAHLVAGLKKSNNPEVRKAVLVNEKKALIRQATIKGIEADIFSREQLLILKERVSATNDEKLDTDIRRFASVWLKSEKELFHSIINKQDDYGINMRRIRAIIGEYDEYQQHNLIYDADQQPDLTNEEKEEEINILYVFAFSQNISILEDLARQEATPKEILDYIVRDTDFDRSTKYWKSKREGLRDIIADKKNKEKTY